MRNDFLNTIYKKDPNIVSRLIAEEVILVPIRNNVADMDFIFTLNETAAYVWNMIDGTRSMSDIIDLVTKEFDVDPSLVLSDLQELVQSLIDVNVLLKVTQP